MLRALYVFFHESPLREYKLHENQIKAIKLLAPGDTRWESHITATHKLLDNFNPVIETLKTLSKTNATANGLLIELKRFDTIGALLAIEGCLDPLHRLSLQCQSTTTDITILQELHENVLNIITNYFSEEYFKSLINKAKALYFEKNKLENTEKITHFDAFSTGLKQFIAALRDEFNSYMDKIPLINMHFRR